jgi:DNA-binding HxlR family transcriptional regulator
VKTYGQYCGLAKALDHVGDRWTLPIVRELLVDARRYSDLRAALPGIATNLLADRLRDLQTDGIITRAKPDGKYELTELGRGLEDAVHGLVRWGARWMGPREADESFRPEWLAVALAALLPKRRSGRVEIRTGETIIGVDRGRVSHGAVKSPDAIVEGHPEIVLGVVAGKLPFSVLNVEGDTAVAAKVLTGP